MSRGGSPATAELTATASRLPTPGPASHPYATARSRRPPPRLRRGRLDVVRVSAEGGLWPTDLISAQPSGYAPIPALLSSAKPRPYAAGAAHGRGPGSRRVQGPSGHLRSSPPCGWGSRGASGGMEPPSCLPPSASTQAGWRNGTPLHPSASSARVPYESTRSGSAMLTALLLSGATRPQPWNIGRGSRGTALRLDTRPDRGSRVFRKVADIRLSDHVRPRHS